MKNTCTHTLSLLIMEHPANSREKKNTFVINKTTINFRKRPGVVLSRNRLEGPKSTEWHSESRECNVFRCTPLVREWTVFVFPFFVFGLSARFLFFCELDGRGCFYCDRAVNFPMKKIVFLFCVRLTLGKHGFLRCVQ